MGTTVKTRSEFDSALYAFDPMLYERLFGLPEQIKRSAWEIRLRAERPVCLTGEKTLYLTADGRAQAELPDRPLTVSRQQLYDLVVSLTERSVYMRADELREGYLSMKQGHRAGVCGRLDGGTLRDLSSVNIRIARSVKGSGAALYGITGGLLIAGSPASGKTTVLRDLVRHLSDGGTRVSIIDTRGEIAACVEGIPTLDVGVNTDVITGTEKAHGTEMALRTLFPQIIAFDEIGRTEELSGVTESFFSGVSVITTAHASSMAELLNRPVTRGLLNSGAVETVALLSGKPGGEIRIMSRDEVLAYDRS